MLSYLYQHFKIGNTQNLNVFCHLHHVAYDCAFSEKLFDVT